METPKEGTTTEPKKEEVRITLLYVGVRKDVKREKVHLWVDISGLPNDGTSLVKVLGDQEEDRKAFYDHRKPKKGSPGGNIAPLARPGAIYSFVKSEGGVYRNGNQYVAFWQCGDDVTRWAVESKAIDLELEMIAEEKKDSRFQADLEVLKPFHEAYINANGRAGAIMLGRIIAYIMRGR